ncbi:uncharacterized protein LOC111371082 [Olea europaea var. sylvestris]|uniref:uncharacterized protein LOC111371082 n=1 Tax=Olea europaea var. sylvestris TaxID=158386 RepID=UPI000C1D7FED|nr:uncharacterized protein LOC111371082 [Olea europaea var. sylvestris]
MVGFTSDCKYYYMERVSTQRQLAIAFTSKMSGNLLSNTKINPKKQAKAITTRSGVQLPKIYVKRLGVIVETSSPAVEETVVQDEQPKESTLKENSEKSQDKAKFTVNPYEPLISFPHYAKFFKDIISNKCKLEDNEAVMLTEECSARIERKLPPKLKDPRSFTVLWRALIDVQRGQLILRLREEHISFNIFKAMKLPAESDNCYQFSQILLKLKHVQDFWRPTCHTPERGTLRNWGREMQSRCSPSTTTSFRTQATTATSQICIFGRVNTLSVIISNTVNEVEEEKLLRVLRENKTTIWWIITDIKEISPSLSMHKILMEENYKPSIEGQGRLNPNMKEVVRAEILKLLDAGIIYPISDSAWISLVQVVPQKGGITVKNEKNKSIPTRTLTGCRVCIDYRKLNAATRKDHFLLPFIDQMLERLVGHSHYCFLDGYSGYNQISVAPDDQEKTIFTCPYGTSTYRKMPFGLYNAPATFQRCMMAIF